MRVAFFSPLPPVKSGIADYAAALLEPLTTLAQIETFIEKPAHFDASRYDIAVYQVGNNPYHAFVYEMALDHPGVVVMHEANLHHLIVDLTIRRDDWDAYLREVEYDGGSEALAFARDYVRTRKKGPDYDGVPMLRRILEKSRGLIVHSQCVAEDLRAKGFAGPIARIPHGAWILRPDRMSYRHRLGLDETAPLIGIFGFLKPYKRITESLRAFRRLLLVEPRARMILVGEPHPDLHLASLLESLDLSGAVRVLGFTPIDDFNGYLGACDIVLNLRFPTVGESSGTLLRSLGMGKAVVVSEVGSFRELPDEICLKAPVDETEEDVLFEFLNLLVSRPQVARAFGQRARQWVQDECNWDIVARRYAGFLESVVRGTEFETPDRAVEPSVDVAEELAPIVADPVAQAVAGASIAREPAPVETVADEAIADEAIAPEPDAAEPVSESYILGWAASPASREYLDTHLTRLHKTLAITPQGGPDDRVLEMGAYLQITPALKSKLGYGEVRGCYYGLAGRTEHRLVRSEEGEEFECAIDLFDAEKDRFPYEDGHFSTVLCCELIEHLFEDPMHLMGEVNRILKPGGHLVLTTPNIASLRAIAGILQGFHPALFPSYIRPRESGEVDARHNREYTPREISDLFENAGFEVTLLETGPFRDQPRPELGWVKHLLDRYLLLSDLRGDGIYAVGRKAGPIRDRYPAWLYS